MAGDIFRSALLVLAFWGVLSGLWPAIGGVTNQYAGAAESSSVFKPAGVVTAPWDTEIAPTQSWIKVHVVADIEVQVLVFALNTRTIRLTNTSGFASADDYVAIANGKASGTDVTLFGSHGGPVRYRISVHVSDNARLAQPSLSDSNVTYTLFWEVQKMDPMVIVGGLILFNMFFVTEYMLHLRRDIRLLGKRVERVSGEGARAPSAALGTPLGTPLGVALEEAAPPPKPRGGLFGRARREDEARLESATASALGPSPYGPPPSSAAPPRYATQAPPESYAPPPYAAPYAPPAPEPEPPAPVYEPPPPLPAPPAPVSRPPPRAPPPPPPRPQAPPAAPEGQEPVSKVRCPQCKHIVPVYTAERPTPIKCPNCGKRGMLTK